MKSRCIIFDLDGTLVDSESIGCRALIDLIPEFNESLESVVERYQGRKLSEILDDIKHRGQCSIPLNFETIYREHVSDLFDKDLKPVPGVIEMLKQINQPKCIASSGPMAKINQSLRVTGLSGYFGTNLYSAYEVGFWKPHPGLFLHAAKEMKFAVDECIVVEDSIAGVEAAKAAGMDLLHFSDGPIEPDSKKYRSFKNMSDLPALLANNRSPA